MFAYDTETRVNSTNAMRTVSLADQLSEDVGDSPTLLDRLYITANAAVYGLANNVIELGKWAGVADDDVTTYDIGQQLDNDGGNLGSAYNKSAWGYNLAGDLVASVIPGAAASLTIKAAKAGKLGKTSMNLFGGFGAAAARSADEMAAAYSTVGSTAKVASYRSAVWKNSVGQQMVEGAFIGAAVEASLNLGEILNDDGLSSMEKFMRFGTSVALGSVIQGGAGGFLSGRATLAKVAQVKSAAFNVDEFPFTYRSLSSTIGNRPSNIPTGNKMAMVIGEYEKISKLKPANPVQENARNLNLAEAEKDMNLVLNEMFPKKASGASNLADEIAPMRELVRSKLATPQGREEVANMMANMHSFKSVQTSAWADNSQLNQMISKLGARTVTREELKAAGAGDSDFYHVVNLKAAGKDKVDTYLMIADDAKISITEKIEMLTDLAMRRTASLKTNVKSVADDFDNFKIAQGIGTNEAEFEVMKKAFALRKELGPREFSKQFAGMGAFFQGIGDDMAEVVYNPKAVSYVDSNTGKITAQPTKHIGDLRGLAYNEGNGVVSWTDKIGTQHAVSTADLPKLSAETDLFKYQSMRLLSGSRTRTQDLTLVSGGINNFSAYTAKDFYTLERALLGKEPKQPNAGQTNQVAFFDVAGNKVNATEAQKALAEFKAKEFQRLAEANPDAPATDILNSIGASEKFAIYRGTVGEVTDATGRKDVVALSDFITDSSALAKRKSYAMEYQQSNMMDTANADIYAAIESYRAIQQARLRDTANQILGEDLEHTFGNSLGIEDVTGFGQQRFISNAAQLGGYQGFIAKASYIGDWVLRKSDEYFSHKIEPSMKDFAKDLMDSNSARAEYAALTEWYAQQSEKFIKVTDGLYVAESAVDSVVQGLKQGIDEGTVLQQLVPNRAYVRINDPATKAYVANMQALNKDHVLNKKLAVENAYGNDVNILQDALYLPPRDYNHMTFIVEGASNPLSPKASNVYRIVANTKEALEQQVQDALAHANRNGLNWTQQTSGDINAYKTAKMQWEWAGDVVKTSTVNSSLMRSGQVQGISPETDAAALVIKDVEWFRRQVTSVHRSAVELHFAEDISQLNTLISQHDMRQLTNLNPVNGVKVKFGTGVAVKEKASDFEQVLSTLLGADNAGASSWRAFNNTLETWAAKALTETSGVFHKLRYKKAQASVAMWEEEGKLVEKALKDKGIGLPMGNYVTDRLMRETTIAPEDIRRYASMMNLVQSTLLLRLDYADYAVNLLGAVVKAGGEMQYLKTLAKSSSPETQANFSREWERLFGAGKAEGRDSTMGMWSTAKAMSAGYGRYFTAEGKADLQRWQDWGLAVDNNKVIRDAFEDMRLDTTFTKTSAQLNSHMSKVAKAGTKMVDFLATPSAQSGMMSQYAALHMAESLGKALGMKESDLRNFMFSFNRRVNAITNPVQKPRLFQGVTGIAVSLYQSYMFHMMRNVFRYADSGSKAPLAAIASLNGTFFGAQSLPGFEMMNNIIASRTEGRTDVYGAASTALGAKINERDASDFLLYGAGAWLLQGGLHTRGTLTPRTPLLIPTSPSELPVVNAAMKAIGSIGETAQKLAYGAPVVQTVAEGFINIGLNRPLIGIMDIARGKAVDNNYSTVMYHDDIWDVSTDAIRIAGLKPLNQVIASSYQQRILAHKALDAKRKIALGEEIRTMYSANPENISDPESVNKWARKYVSSGGTAGNFEGFLSDQLLKAKEDLAQRLERTVGKSDAALAQYRAVLGN